MRSLVLVSICLLTLSQAAQAALFGDDEARRKIADLQQQVQTQNQSMNEIKKNQQALDQRLAAMEAVIKGQGLMDLLGQIERLNQELSRVKGQLEVATHNIETAQQRQRDLYGDVDGRLRKLESGSVATPATNEAPATAAPASAAVNAAANTAAADANAEAKDYATANALSRAGRHKESFDAYEKFLQTYPNSSLAPDAQYALGYAQFSLKNYKAAIATQQKLIKQYPDSPKVPDAMFNIANSQIQLADIEGAKKTIRNLLSLYPNSDVAPTAKRRLTVLDSIKSK